MFKVPTGRYYNGEQVLECTVVYAEIKKDAILQRNYTQLTVKLTDPSRGISVYIEPRSIEPTDILYAYDRGGYQIAS